jgi:hypothetical protein
MVEELAKSLCRSIEVKAVLEVKYQVIKDILRRMRGGEEIVSPISPTSRLLRANTGADPPGRDCCAVRKGSSGQD